MRLLWLSNLAPGPVQAHLTSQSGSGLWMDHVLEFLQKDKNIKLRMLCPWTSRAAGKLSETCSFCTFVHEKPQKVSLELQNLFLSQLGEFQPDVVHIWGTEFGHTLAMVRACEQAGFLDRTVISIQGLCLYVGKHYTEGLPLSVQRRFTLRDFLRQDNILMQQKTFLARGENEKLALAGIRHVMGRTHWDRACARQLCPKAKYETCNEVLRESFYEGQWTYAACEKHRIFTPSRLYPIKGFHYALEALHLILKEYPDAVLAVPGENPCCHGMARLRQDSYARYLGELMETYDLHDHVEFLGAQSEEGMKEQLLKANVFLLPSTIENSSNSLGEAMLLGVPAVATDAGGTATLLENGKEGILCQSTAPYMLADGVLRIFDEKENAEVMGRAAAAHGAKTHAPEENFRRLLEIYRSIREGKESGL